MSSQRTFRTFSNLLMVVCWVMALVSSTGAASNYIITDLGTLGGSSSRVEGINDKGQAIGSSQTGNENTHAFIWTVQKGMTDLGALDGNFTDAYAINAGGQVVGSAKTGDDEIHPYLWDSAKGIQDLGTLGGDYSLAWSVNSAVQVCGASKTNLGKNHAFFWDSVGGLQDLGGLDGDESAAFEINAGGQVAGDAQTPVGDWHGFLWDTAHGIQDLGALGGSESGVWDLNDSGQVVGGADLNDFVQHGFLWDRAGGMQDLRTLCGGLLDTSSEAYAINRFGQVVGWSEDCDFNTRAFLWSSEHGMQDLGALGGMYSIAYSLNDCSQVVGEAETSNGDIHAFLWDEVNGIQDLGTLGGTDSSALHINSLGQAVGYARSADANPHAVLFAPPPVLTLVTKYYRDILRRCSDAAGATYWFDAINDIVALGIGIQEGFLALSKNFFNSQEYLSYGRSDEAYLVDLYRTFFDRDPDAGGLTSWLDALAQGITRNGAVIAFVNSTEFTEYLTGIFGSVVVRPEFNLVNDFYRGLLGRFPDQGGFAFWVGQMQQAQCAGAQQVEDVSRQIAHLFSESSEYATRARTNSLFVEDLYDAVLRRGQDAGGFTYWTDQLNSELMIRQELLDAFIDSAEFQGRVQSVVAAGCL
jgi:probable HAF family extracellular repeat protein